MDKKRGQIICTAFANGKRHDFRLFKESKIRFKATTKVLTDTGYQGLHKLHANSALPKKKSKKSPLTKRYYAEKGKLLVKRCSFDVPKSA